MRLPSWTIFTCRSRSPRILNRDPHCPQACLRSWPPSPVGGGEEEEGGEVVELMPDAADLIIIKPCDMVRWRRRRPIVFFRSSCLRALVSTAATAARVASPASALAATASFVVADTAGIVDDNTASASVHCGICMPTGMPVGVNTTPLPCSCCCCWAANAC